MISPDLMLSYSEQQPRNLGVDQQSEARGTMTTARQYARVHGVFQLVISSAQVQNLGDDKEPLFGSGYSRTVSGLKCTLPWIRVCEF